MTTPQVPVYGMVKNNLLRANLTETSLIHTILNLISFFLSLLPALHLHSPVISPAPTSDDSSDGGRSHDAPTACHVQPAGPETQQSLWTHPGGTGNTKTHTKRHENIKVGLFLFAFILRITQQFKLLGRFINSIVRKYCE